MLCLLLKANPDTGKEVADSNGVEDGDGAGLASEIRKMPTRGQGRGRRGVTPHGVTARAVLTLAVSSMPSNDLAQNSSPAPHISESAQPNVSLTPVDASVTKNVRGKTKGLALAKIRGRREKVKLGFSRTLRQPTSENDDDLIRCCGTPNWLVKMQTKCDKYKDNREKPRIHHVTGSKAFYKAKNDLKKKCMNHDLPETWKETHYSQKRKCWTDGAEGAYICLCGVLYDFFV
ncbi:hypothetical protein RHGRI_006312 [Rhododendron griersonianum]|uniref:Uncharacterized protein n=1 Tax=Rhododendron griersonianum TaxID=479676 RepID=A0AAV6KT72_9ERIC|nr:hypothetical protein RHGRI_006312 [Rhododendron griersonianum]KAG5555617.1 hypothetical protein RHGRI_006312 [Rhododendron griersonianum]